MKKSKTPTKDSVITQDKPEIVESTDTPAPLELNGNRFDYFTTSVYKIEIPSLLTDARKCSNRALTKFKKENPKMDPIFPLYQTHDISNDPDIAVLAQYIADISYDTLQGQGYDMRNKRVYFSSMWVQEHFQHSAHEEHIHGQGAQIVGFYFLDVPKDSSRLVFHDPRPSKKQVNLPEANITNATYASDAVNFVPNPGDLFIINAWTPHSIGRNHSKSPVRLIHFTLNVDEMINPTSPTAGTINIDVGDQPEII
jgi:uncharacterized protein (TIGR02466 family)